MAGTSETTAQQVPQSNSRWRSARLTLELAGKSILIGLAIAVLMIVMQFRLGTIFLVGATSACAAMLLAVAEFEAIATGRSNEK